MISLTFLFIAYSAVWTALFLFMLLNYSRLEKLQKQLYACTDSESTSPTRHDFQT